MTIKDPEISENTKQDKLQKKNSMLGYVIFQLKKTKHDREKIF